MSFKSHNVHYSSSSSSSSLIPIGKKTNINNLTTMGHHLNMNHHANTDMLKLKKPKMSGSYSKMNQQYQSSPPTSVARRNERERNRVKMVNMGFATLRQHVPNGVKNKKMSKVETLRSAVEYIRQLQRLLGQNVENSLSAEQYEQMLQAAGASSEDENCYPNVMDDLDHHHMAPSPMESTSSLEQMSYSNATTTTTINYQTIPIEGSVLYSPLSNSSGEMQTKTSTYNSPESQHHHNQHHHHNPHSHHHHHHNHHQTRTSPSPSVSSDMTTSSSSPYDQQSLLDNVQRQTVPISNVGNEDELFDFTNWF